MRTYRLTRRAADLTVALGCAWLGVTLYANLVLGGGTLGFYAGHLLEIAAVALVGLPAALDIKRAGASRPLVGDLTATELVASEEAYLGPRVRALMVRLERRDVSTEEHTRRVALLAARVGEELKLSATARRHLAVGGLLHDIGKLSVPLEILNKPGKLTDEEFAAIKRHPGDGRKLLEELGGFPEAVRGLVSDHHERLDGSGYPRGLQRREMSVETRILAVVDVYDALVSDRVYRAAWSPERAFGAARGGGARVRPDRRRRAQARRRAVRGRRLPRARRRHLNDRPVAEGLPGDITSPPSSHGWGCWLKRLALLLGVLALILPVVPVGLALRRRRSRRVRGPGRRPIGRARRRRRRRAGTAPRASRSPCCAG